ncbi:MAG TPA: Asp-tRNA(Asn)/Glu-tRNA(Gln) amidotransferase subunit GatB [Candidatus Binataceae bacterium]|jgi:aspartyl-tRNA(Asn)/glutamyl-tRNA(Gln) amidotransferase subunit B|nr:Asp-tRNA(Asn)/Glu-tRNA(Gln) amidotransferase subunit GatB [Candidatus Binataceae bacterium]
MANDANEAVIGLEVHAHMLTRSKLFCGCATDFGAPPNSNVCPVCVGMPGVLPVLNRHVVELAIRTGLAAHSKIEPHSVFARKSYFYPDLPKGYQISQYDEPLCRGGYIELPPRQGGEPRRIRLVRIHLEEDAGKNIHADSASLVDFNRSGVPLMEIVSEPDLRTPEEAVDYLHELRGILVCVGASDGKMEEGSLRCDVNVSVRPRGATELGARTEIKNLNSFRFVEKAIVYEVNRQIEEIAAGRRIAQETHLWDPEREVTRPMRSKEFANDYRYFPEPDLPPLIVPPDLVESIRAAMPEMPAERREKYARDFGLSPYEVGVLTEDLVVGEYFVSVLAEGVNAKTAANWVMTEVLRAVNESGKPLGEAVPEPRETGVLLRMVEESRISLNAAKSAFAAMCRSGKGAAATIADLGLVQVSDEASIVEACDRVLAAEDAKVAEYRAGREKLFGFFVGAVMKAMGGKGNPKVVNEVLRRKLAGKIAG